VHLLALAAALFLLLLFFSLVLRTSLESNEEAVTPMTGDG
jgi:hypothetical protein